MVSTCRMKFGTPATVLEMSQSNALMDAACTCGHAVDANGRHKELKASGSHSEDRTEASGPRAGARARAVARARARARRGPG